MNTRDLSLAGVILLIVLGVRISPKTSPPTSERSITSTEPKANEHEAPPVWKALCRLNPDYGADPRIDEKLSRIADDALDPDCLTEHHPNESWIMPVIATVADPIRTNLGLSTDRAIEAIQAASGDAGYVPYVQGLPWPSLPGTSKQSETSSASSPVESGLPPASGKSYDSRYPGVLVFRASDDLKLPHPRYLAVFLVSETPTGGLDKEQFFAAVRIIGNIPRAVAEAPLPRTVAVAGPNFSGSVASLQEIAAELVKTSDAGRAALVTTADPVLCLHAFSGTVTNAGSTVADADNASKLKSFPVCALRLENLQTDDRTGLDKVRNWATGIGLREEQIAILSEEGTRYGRLPEDPNSDRFLRLHFPRGIAALRNATDTGQNSLFTSNPASGPQRLPLRWQDSESQADEVPLYGAYQTSLSQETVLANLASTLRTEDIKVLEIMASDPWDVTFLIHWFTEATPNVRLFVRDADFLYLRTPDLGSVTGVLAVSDYPLIAENQFWSADQSHRGDRHLLTLPSSSQEAQYNAFTELLEQLHPRVIDHPLRHLEDQVTSVVTPGTPTKHLWLATTGTDGYWPIKVLSPDSTELVNTEGDPHTLDVGKPSYSALLVWLFVAIGAMAHALGVLVSAKLSCERFARMQSTTKLMNVLPCFLTFDLEDTCNTIAASKFVFHGVALSTAGLGTFVAGASFVFFWHSAFSLSYFHPYRVLAFLVLLVTLFVFFVAGQSLHTGLDRCKRILKSSSLGAEQLQEARKLGSAGLLFAAIPVAGSAFWLYLSLSNRLDYAFLHLRDLHLGSGVAPVLPILLLLFVFYWGIWVHLRRVSRWEYGSAEMPTGLDDVFPSNCSPYVQRITRALLQFPERPWGWMMLVCFAFGLLLFLPMATMDMLEPRPVQYFTLFCFFLASLVLWSNWVRFMYIWQQMRAFLRILEKLPMRAAFSRISTESTLSIWGWSVAPGKLLPVREGVEALRALRRLTGDTFVSAKVSKRLFSAIHRFLGATSDSAINVTEELQRPATRAGDSQPKSSDADGNQAKTVAYEQPVLMVAGGERGTIRETIVFSETPHEFAPPLTITLPTNGKGQPDPSDNPRAATHSDLKQLYRDMREAMTEVINQLIPHLTTYWGRGEVWPGNSPIPVNRPRRKTDSEDRRYEVAEELVGLRYYSYIRYVGTELRHLLMFVVLAYFGLFLALHSYSFRASRSIDLAFISLFVVLGLGMILTFSQQERDALLSRLQRSTAGELGTNFYIDVLKYAGIPALALIASHVPSISNFFLRWIQPSLDAMR
jgi:hypothetical protein